MVVPVLLIAANVGAMRDHKQSDRIEILTKQNEEMGERLLAVEQLLEKHVTHNLAAHAMALGELSVMVREVHTAICEPKPASNGASASLPDPEPAIASTSASEPVSALPAKPGRKRSQPLNRSSTGKTSPEQGR